MKKTTILAALLLALGSNFCGGAYAAATASGTIEHISYTLVDLNPNDGIAPSVTFANVKWPSDDWWGAYSEVYVTGWDGFSGGRIVKDSFGHGAAFTPVGASEDRTGVSFKGIISGDRTVGGSKLSGQASAFMDRTDGLHHYGDVKVRMSSGPAKFTLSPMTAIRFLADSSVSAEVDGAPDRILFEDAYIWSGLTITSKDYPATRLLDQKTITLQSGTTAGIHPAHEMNTTALDLLYTNDTALNFYGAVEANMIIATSSDAVLAVPEPSTYLMFGAGLALLGLGVRRQRKAQP